MNTIDNDIPNLYKLEFERSLPGCNIYCDILPQYQSICFVHCQREILHAIELCFKENNIPTKFKDSQWCKAIIIPIQLLPAVPPFTNIKKHFLKCYLDRLNDIEELFEKRNITYTDLLLIKNKLLKKSTINYTDMQSLRLQYDSKRLTNITNAPALQ